MFPEALVELREAARLTNNSPLLLSAYGEALAESGDRQGSLEVLGRVQQLRKDRYVSPYDVSMIYAALGKKDRAFEWLDRARRDRASFLPYITWDRRADNLRSDARFDVLLRQLGLKPPIENVGQQSGHTLPTTQRAPSKPGSRSAS